MNNNENNLKKYLPGYLQGITRVCISYPFDYIRIFLQVDNKITIKNIIVNNKNLFKGLYIPLFFVPIDRAISLNFYEKFKRENYNTFLIALLPSIISSIYMTPINIINYNYIYNNNNISTIFKKFLNTNTYRGNLIEMTRNIISGFLFLTSYNYLSKHNQNHFINGSLSSIFMWSIIYPLDTIKTKKFVNNTSYENIFKKTQLLHYYRGLSLVLLRTIPSGGAGMFIYEKTKNIF